MNLFQVIDEALLCKMQGGSFILLVLPDSPTSKCINLMKI